MAPAFPHVTRASLAFIFWVRAPSASSSKSSTFFYVFSQQTWNPPLASSSRPAAMSTPPPSPGAASPARPSFLAAPRSPWVRRVRALLPPSRRAAPPFCAPGRRRGSFRRPGRGANLPPVRHTEGGVALLPPPPPGFDAVPGVSLP